MNLVIRMHLEFLHVSFLFGMTYTSSGEIKRNYPISNLFDVLFKVVPATLPVQYPNPYSARLEPPQNQQQSSGASGNSENSHYQLNIDQ